MAKKAQYLICQSSQVPELNKFAFKVVYRGEPREAILIRFKQEIYGYLNQCVHMPKALDCEEDNIFDESGSYLQCSMHNICYDPTTGEVKSELCAGKKLTALKILVDGDNVFLVDKRAVIE